MSLAKFKHSLKESMISLAWMQWTALGVAGQTETTKSRIIDPEALLLFTTYIGREDQRLFDLTLDWLQINGRFINTQRLKTMLKRTSFESSSVLGYMAASLSSFEARAKWSKLAETLVPKVKPKLTPLFNNTPLSTAQKRDPQALRYGFERNIYIPTNKALAFSTESLATLLLRFRGFLGVSARCEVLLTLLCNDFCTIQETANSSGYSWRSIQDILFEMNKSGYIGANEAKRGRYYFLKNREERLKSLDLRNALTLTFPNWLSVYNACISLLIALQNPRLSRVSPLSIQGVVESVFTKIGPTLMECGMEELRFISADNYKGLPQILEQL